MNNRETVIHLREKIKKSLSPLIGKRCILVDVPYYQNIGDMLIWEGEKDFLKAIGCECICSASYWTFKYPQIDKDVTVLFNGGGNIGDLYPEHVNLLLKVARFYPHNKIVVLPQTVYYENKQKEERDLSEINKHSQLVFCARDGKVANDVSRYIDNVITVPDMAFYNDVQKLDNYKVSIKREKLIIKRVDPETSNASVSKNGDIADWPTLVKSFRRTTFINKLFYRLAKAGIVFSRLWDWYFHKYHSMLMVKEGVRFISPYKEVETTRLHGCILSILLDKKVVLIDNSYGKNSEFYKSWLANDDDVTLKQ